MKNKLLKGAFCTLTLTLCLLMIVSCSKAPGDFGEDFNGYFDGLKDEEVMPQQPAGDEAIPEFDYDQSGNKVLAENPFVSTATEPTSTFSADVDSASYTYFRKLVAAGYSFEELAATAGKSLRTEEMVNYFDYACPAPAEGMLFGYKAQVAPAPWNGENALLMLTLKTEEMQVHQQNNLVFLIDVSGSMSSQDKLPLLKNAFAYLVDRLDGDDRVSIVTYSGREAVILEGCEGSKKEIILNAVNGLSASGSTNGQAGLQKAYELAERYFIEGGNNRIFMASDGDLNVGISSPEELKDYISQKKDAGVFLSVLGFGTGNYKDSAMEALADNGNGVYYYIDGGEEAERIFGQDLFASLYTVAKDVKLQLTFNPEIVDEYRLIGYENRILNNEDFMDDTKDAGELGAGHSVTVLYELKVSLASESAPFGSLAVRYKAPDGIKSDEESFEIGGELYTLSPDDDFRLASAVAELSLLLKDSAYKGRATRSHLLGVLNELAFADEYKAQFLRMAKSLLQ